MEKGKELLCWIAIGGILAANVALLGRQHPLHADLRLLDSVRCNDVQSVQKMLKPIGAVQKIQQYVWHGRPLWYKNCYLTTSIAVDCAVRRKNAAILDLLLSLNTELVLDDYEEIELQCMQVFMDNQTIDLGNVILDHCVRNTFYLQRLLHQLNEKWFVQDRLYDYLRRERNSVTWQLNVLARFTFIKGKNDIVSLSQLPLPSLLNYHLSVACLEPYSTCAETKLIYSMVRLINEE